MAPGTCARCGRRTPTPGSASVTSSPLLARHPGLVRILAADDVPGDNRFGIYATGKDQPVLAEGYVRYRGEAVLALVGDAATVASIADDELPIEWEPLPPILGHRRRPGRGRAPAPRGVARQRAGRGPRPAGRRGRGPRRGRRHGGGTFETTYVEHAYIEPEAGTARVVDGRVEVFATTQTPYMDRDELALILGLPEDRVRVIPSACGGGFGGKLDLSLQPLIAIAALLLDHPVRAVYPRPESMAATTKRHPARIRATFGADAEGA